MAASPPRRRNDPVVALRLDDEGNVTVLTRAELDHDDPSASCGIELLENDEGDRTFTQVVIRSLYNDGCEMFSKDIFRNVAEQFDLCAKHPNVEHRVSLMGIDGIIVDFFFKLGADVTDGGKVRWPGCRIKTSKPRLDYRGIRRLMLAAGSPHSNPEGAYLTIGIVLETEIYDATTNAVLSPWLDRSCHTVLQRFYRERQS
ncbi:uncharacterized protein C8A04DRAFT_33449 [Dichotomopilus funicola]|uniref:Uncharacterized protein n=1 Tax=Dichotomopilus funicola TaxID=1934379 RepID=A0AAN6ZIR6_9PEZI|nr:hypothetical protein C8A04DRAFT_33449 [Dichotomopilus funicola]